MQIILKILIVEFAIIIYHTETECYLNSMITVRG